MPGVRRGAAAQSGRDGRLPATTECRQPRRWTPAAGFTGATSARSRDHGYLTIVDRKKELIINAAGKNMSPANIEAHLKAASSVIGHAVVIGDRRPYNTVLILLDPDTLALRAERRGLRERAVRALAHDEQLQTEISAAVDQANSHLSRVEQVKRFTILDHDWPPGGAELTPTLKPKRRAIAEGYAQTIEAMYASRRWTRALGPTANP